MNWKFPGRTYKISRKRSFASDFASIIRDSQKSVHFLLWLFQAASQASHSKDYASDGDSPGIDVSDSYPFQGIILGAPVLANDLFSNAVGTSNSSQKRVVKGTPASEQDGSNNQPIVGRKHSTLVAARVIRGQLDHPNSKETAIPCHSHSPPAIG